MYLFFFPLPQKRYFLTLLYIPGVVFRFCFYAHYILSSSVSHLCVYIVLSLLSKLVFFICVKSLWISFLHLPFWKNIRCLTHTNVTSKQTDSSLNEIIYVVHPSPFNALLADIHLQSEHIQFNCLTLSIVYCIIWHTRFIEL